jgi:acyl-coenzyme A thioesterase PaaI-like protein
MVKLWADRGVGRGPTTQREANAMADIEGPAGASFGAVRETLQRIVPFNRHLGLEILEVGAGSAVVRMPDREELANHVGTRHAAALFAAGEAASGATVAGLLASRFGADLGSVTAVATGADIRYARPAKGTITARGKLEGDGPSLLEELESNRRAEFAVEVGLADERGRAVAEMVVQWYTRLRRA